MRQSLSCSCSLIRSSVIDPWRSIDLDKFLPNTTTQFGLIDVYMNEEPVEEELKYFRDTIICGDSGSGFCISSVHTQECTRISRYKLRKLQENSFEEDCCLVIQEKENYLLSASIRRITAATSLDILLDPILNSRGLVILGNRNESVESVIGGICGAITNSSIDMIKRFGSPNLSFVCEAFLAISSPVYWIFADNDDDFHFQGCGALSYLQSLCNYTDIHFKDSSGGCRSQ